MISRTAILIAAFAIAAAAQTIPSGWKVIKDDKGACQIAVPGDWKPGSVGGIANDAAGTLSVMLVLEHDAKVEPLNEMDLKIRKVLKVHDNTNRRVWTEGRTTSFGPKPSRPWNVWVPANAKGACHAAVGLKTGASEELAKQIVATLGPAK